MLLNMRVDNVTEDFIARDKMYKPVNFNKRNENAIDICAKPDII